MGNALNASAAAESDGATQSLPTTPAIVTVLSSHPLVGSPADAVIHTALALHGISVHRDPTRASRCHRHRRHHCLVEWSRYVPRECMRRSSPVLSSGYARCKRSSVASCVPAPTGGDDGAYRSRARRQFHHPPRIAPSARRPAPRASLVRAALSVLSPDRPSLCRSRGGHGTRHSLLSGRIQHGYVRAFISVTAPTSATAEDSAVRGDCTVKPRQPLDIRECVQMWCTLHRSAEVTPLTALEKWRSVV